jgi:pyruvate/2-oxoglutarate dehydrogenase complex dihydrolipoamide acyltransferase (E2) component
MAVSVVMPALEMAQDSGKLVSWLKQEGESVRKGEMLLEVETDKAVVEVEAAADGILAGVSAKPGDVCTSATPSRGSCSQVNQCRQHVTRGRAFHGPSASAIALRSPVSSPARSAARISPKARRLAQEKGSISAA